MVIINYITIQKGLEECLVDTQLSRNIGDNNNDDNNKTIGCLDLGKKSNENNKEKEEKEAEKEEKEKETKKKRTNKMNCYGNEEPKAFKLQRLINHINC